MESNQGGYGNAVDVWSLGIILYTLFIGAPPFNGETREKLFENIRLGNIDFSKSHWDTVSLEGWSLFSNKRGTRNEKAKQPNNEKEKAAADIETFFFFPNYFRSFSIQIEI